VRDEAERDRDRQRETERDRERQRETERDRERQRETESDGPGSSACMYSVNKRPLFSVV